MARETKGKLIRRMRVKDVAATVPIPSTLKHLFEDGFDVCVVVQVKRHLIRANLSVSSGQELVIPDWLKKALHTLSKEQKVDDVAFYLSIRPIWLVQGEQDSAIKEIWSWKKNKTTWDSLPDDQRREVALRWIIEQLASMDRDTMKQMLHDLGF